MSAPNELPETPETTEHRKGHGRREVDARIIQSATLSVGRLAAAVAAIAAVFGFLGNIAGARINTSTDDIMAARARIEVLEVAMDKQKGAEEYRTRVIESLVRFTCLDTTTSKIAIAVAGLPCRTVLNGLPP